MNHRRPLRDGRRPVGLALALVAGLAVVAGCSGPGGDQAAQAADSFERLAVGDTAQACALLAPKTHDEVEKAAKKSCPEALGDEDLPDPSPMTGVEVYGHDAIVRFAGDTVFLARYPEGWRVTAAGCKPGSSEQKPYDCDVAGS